jgi:hypothetical protein
VTGYPTSQPGVAALRSFSWQSQKATRWSRRPMSAPRNSVGC